MWDLSEQQRKDASHCSYNLTKSDSSCINCSCRILENDCICNYIMNAAELAAKDWKEFKSFLDNTSNHFNSMKTLSDKDKMQETIYAIEREIKRLHDEEIIR